jgi:uncharacterized repeat protein (TIGR03803 family)
MEWCGTIFKLTPSGTETILFRLEGRYNGPGPNAGLVLDAASNLYGTFPGHDCPYTGDCGSVFKLGPTGTFTGLYSFTGGADGGDPLAGLIRDGAGNLYGTASSNDTCYGCGVVFKLSPTGTYKVLYSFTEGADGTYPRAELVRDGAGNLYGTTEAGGTGTCNLDFLSGCGVVFELIRCDSAPSGYEYKVLYRFTGGADGANPVASLIRDTAGNLYGTTPQGGHQSSACTFEQGYGGNGTCGVVFKVSPNGTETVLYRFTGGADGGNPVSGLVRDASGNLYGTTQNGGSESSACMYFGTTCGVVFKLSPTGAETVLHTFTGGADGGNPIGLGLIQDLAGNLYGTAAAGGESFSTCGETGCGVVFKLTP